MAEQYVNAVSTTLAFDITTTGQSSIIVSSATGFPTGPNFRILVGGTELMLVTGVSGTTWTVTRGIEYTTPITATAGATVEHLMTAGALSQIRADSFSTGTFANLPSNPVTGVVYVPTDSFYDFLRYNGSSWDYFRNGRLLTPPVASDFSWANQGNATLTTTSGANVMWVSQAIGAQLNIRHKAAPATPYTITMGFLAHWWQTASNTVGLCWLEGTGTGKVVAYGAVGYWNNPCYRIYKFNGAATGYNSDYVSNPIVPVVYHGPMIWARITNDGSNRTCQISGNGYNWSTLHSVGVNDYITTSTAHRVGFYVGDLAADLGITVLHWKEE